MPILDIIRSIFGFNNNNQDQICRPENPRQENNFRKPIWENEDDDDDYNSDFRHQQGDGIHFELFGDPIEITRTFESQINSIMKQFLGSFTGQTGEFFSQFDSNALPAPPEFSNSSKSLRDNVLQREFDSAESDLKNQVREDSDLDGKISNEELVKFWKSPKEQQIESVQKPQNSFFRYSGASTSTRITSKNGMLEKQQTFKDSDGNKQTIVRRQMGDKVHEFITKVDKDGVETKTENFINMDENDIKTFDNNWKSDTVQNRQEDLNSRNYFPWHEFFSPDPKL